MDKSSCHHKHMLTSERGRRATGLSAHYGESKGRNTRRRKNGNAGFIALAGKRVRLSIHWHFGVFSLCLFDWERNYKYAGHVNTFHTFNTLMHEKLFLQSVTCHTNKGNVGRGPQMLYVYIPQPSISVGGSVRFARR